MTKFIIIHCKHDGCNENKLCKNDIVSPAAITINTPKVFFFENKYQACEFFSEYINDVDIVDVRCKKGSEIEHIHFCTCGIIELDEEGQPILFYDSKNQIFLLEMSAQVFTVPQTIKNDINNINITNSLIRKCKNLGREQKHKYIELGKMCEEHMND